MPTKAAAKLVADPALDPAAAKMPVDLPIPADLIDPLPPPPLPIPPPLPSLDLEPNDAIGRAMDFTHDLRAAWRVGVGEPLAPPEITLLRDVTDDPAYRNRRLANDQKL